MKPSRFRQHRPGGKPRRVVRHPPPAVGLPAAPTAVDVVRAPIRGLHAVPSDDRWSDDTTTWLPLARNAWQRGDWTLLASLGERPLHRHPDRSRLALLAAAGHFHLGGHGVVRKLVELALAWGCDRQLVARVLISGLHNTLGRAASALDQPAQALTQFSAAVLTASPSTSSRKIMQLRAAEQLAQLGLSLHEPASVQPALQPAPTLRPQARHPLGKHRLAAKAVIVSDTEWQYLAFPVDTTTLHVLQRHLASGHVQGSRLPDDGAAAVGASASGLQLALDQHGRLHLGYSSEDGSLTVRQAVVAGSISDWTPNKALSAPGTATGLARLVAAHAGAPLLALYGAHDGAELRLLAFRDGGWSERAVLPQAQAGGTTRLRDLVVDDDGTLHLLTLTADADDGWWLDHTLSSDHGASWLSQEPLLLPDAPGSAARLVPARGPLQLLCGRGGRWLLHWSGGRWTRQRLDHDACHLVADAQGRSWAFDSGGCSAWPPGAWLDLQEGMIVAVDTERLRHGGLLTLLVADNGSAATEEQLWLLDFGPP